MRPVGNIFGDTTEDARLDAAIARNPEELGFWETPR